MREPVSFSTFTFLLQPLPSSVFPTALNCQEQLFRQAGDSSRQEGVEKSPSKDEAPSGDRIGSRSNKVCLSNTLTNDIS